MNRSSAQRRLAAAQRRCGLTDEALARKCGVSRTTIAKFKRGGDLRLRTLERIAAGVGCAAAWLAFGLGAARITLREGDALVVRASLNECSSAQLEAWVEELRRAAPGKPVVVILRTDLETMPAGLAMALRKAQEAVLEGFSGTDSEAELGPPAATEPDSRRD